MTLTIVEVTKTKLMRC